MCINTDAYNVYTCKEVMHIEAFLEALMLLVSDPESHRRSLPLQYIKLFLGKWYNEYMERSKKSTSKYYIWMFI